jgi:hypothetical protein
MGRRSSPGRVDNTQGRATTDLARTTAPARSPPPPVARIGCRQKRPGNPGLFFAAGLGLGAPRPVCYAGATRTLLMRPARTVLLVVGTLTGVVVRVELRFVGACRRRCHQCKRAGENDRHQLLSLHAQDLPIARMKRPPLESGSRSSARPTHPLSSALSPPESVPGPILNRLC